MPSPLLLRVLVQSCCLLAALGATGCVAAHRVWDNSIETVDGPPVVGAPRARIANPELEEEELIICRSGLYTIVDDPDEAVDVTLRLSPLVTGPYGCGGGLFLWAMTIGIGPGATNDTFTFTFEEVETNTTRSVRGVVTKLVGLTANMACGFTGRGGAIGDAVGKVFREGYQLPVQPAPRTMPESAESRPSG